jgi:hypothetical protein
MSRELVVSLCDDELTIHKYDEEGFQTTAMRAGYELARYLRSRDFLVIHVFPSFDKILPDLGSIRVATLVKLLASLIYATVFLIKADSILNFGTALSEANFRVLARGDAGSFDAGLAILSGMPKLEQCEARKMVFVVDGLDSAVCNETQDKVRRFERVLRGLCTREHAYLVYTIGDNRVQVGELI